MSGTFNSFIKAANKQRAVEASYLLTGLPIPNTEAAQLYNTGTATATWRRPLLRRRPGKPTLRRYSTPRGSSTG
jgi:hypothetical protein